MPSKLSQLPSRASLCPLRPRLRHRLRHNLCSPSLKFSLNLSLRHLSAFLQVSMKIQSTRLSALPTSLVICAFSLCSSLREVLTRRVQFSSKLTIWQICSVSHKRHRCVDKMMVMTMVTTLATKNMVQRTMVCPTRQVVTLVLVLALLWTANWLLYLTRSSLLKSLKECVRIPASIKSSCNKRSSRTLLCLQLFRQTRPPL